MDGAITVGRNVNDKPMPADDWRSFVADLEGAITKLGGTIYATTYSSAGCWKGVTEENAVITFSNLEQVAHLRWDLEMLAVTYGQDRIALLLGQTELVGA